MKTKQGQTNKLKARQAEVAAEHWMMENMECVAIRRAVRTKWQAVDFFGADLVGVLATGAKVYVQVTTGSHSAMSSRRAKLGAFPWHPSESVILVRLVSTKSPVKGKAVQWWFRVEEYQSRAAGRTWLDWPECVPVPREWFKKVLVHAVE